MQTYDRRLGADIGSGVLLSTTTTCESRWHDQCGALRAYKGSLQILYGRPARLAASPTAHFVHPHFREQAALLNGLAPFIGFFSRGEARQSWWVPDPEEILEAWGAAREHVGQWLRPESKSPDVLTQWGCSSR